jgi:cell cycle sensor histidine kinase DivJ
MLGLLGTFPALLYAGLLAARAGTMARGLAVSERDARDHLRRIADAASDVLMTVRRNGNVTFATDAAKTVFSVPGAALCGDGLFARIHVADRPAYLAALDDAAGGADTTSELRIDRAGDDAAPDYIWAEMRCRAMASAGGQSPDIVASISRIEARKETEGRMRTAQEEAERANIAKGRFLASVSHELRTPLNAIIGFSEILRSGGGPGGNPMVPDLTEEKRCEYADMIHESGIHLLEVVNDILDMSKIESGNFEIFPEPFDLVALAESCRRMVADQAAEAGLRVDTDLPHSVAQIRADQRACKQILLNLLSNALKFSKPGGRVVIGAYREGSGVVLYVADEGIGIARCDMGRIGEPFQQLENGHHRRYLGTGLGLSVVKGLVALHGGSLEIDSEVGVGTRILIRLPREAVIEPDSEGAIAAPAPYRLIA